MTIGEHLLHVADAGLALCDVNMDEKIYTHLTVLLAIEETLDQGRISLALTGSGTECRGEINAKMDLLRSKIKQLIDQCNEEEFLRFMESRSNRLKSQFNTGL